MSRRDDVSALYKPSNIIHNVIMVLFYANVFVAGITIATSDKVKEILILLQIVIAFSYFVLSVLNDGYFFYNAESARRKAAIENALNVDITGLQTDGYYNNSITPSLYRYVVNIFESLHFSKSIVSKMMIPEFIKAFIVVLIFIISCIEVNNGELLLLIAQTVFSSRFIVGSILLALYASKLKNLYNEFYGQLVSVGLQSEKQLNRLLAMSVEYESIKAHYKIRLSTWFFSRLNPSLSKEWDSIAKKIPEI